MPFTTSQRIKLEKEVSLTHSPTEVRRLTVALESAIEGVETIYSKQYELRALRSLHRLIERSRTSQSGAMDQAARAAADLIDQTAATHNPAMGAQRNFRRLLHWPGA